MTYLLKTTLLAAGLVAGIGGAAQASLTSGAIDQTTVLVTDSAAPVLQEARRGRGADDPVGHKRRGRGADDGAGHTELDTQPIIQEARRGRGADDPVGHNRRGRGADDAPAHG